MCPQLVTDFFFPSELHDTLSLEQFRASFPIPVRGAAHRDDGGLEGGSGDWGVAGVLPRLYEEFLQHRQRCRETVRAHIDVSVSLGLRVECAGQSFPRQGQRERVFGFEGGGL